MAIILRGDKGSALSHQELDNNFRQFVYSSSISGTAISLFTSASVCNEMQIPGGAPSGSDYSIQYKVGSADSGSNALFGATPNFIYDYRQNKVKLTGSLNTIGDHHVDGDVTVTGIITGKEFHTVLVSSSVVYQSGSTQFGDTPDDTHDFIGTFNSTGDMNVDGDLTVTGTLTAQEVRTEFQNAAVIFESGSTKFGDTLEDKHAFTGSLQVTGSQTVTGNLTVFEGAFMNPDTVTKHFKVPANYNAGLFGPITNSALIQVEDNATLTII